jgi:hypothetical protein
MWANTVWGFIGLAAACALAGIPMIFSPGPELGRALFVGSGISAFLAVVSLCWPLIKKSNQLQLVSFWYPFGYMPIELAATKAYQRNTESFAAGWAAALSPATPIPDSMSKQILEDTTVQIFGKRPLECKLREIRRGSFSNGKASFHGNRLLYEGKPMFEDVAIKRRDLSKAIQELSSKSS